MEHSQSEIELLDTKDMSNDDLQKSNDINQKSHCGENEKDKVIKILNFEPSESISSDTAENKIVVLDYTPGRQNYHDFKLFNNLKFETIFSNKLNISYQDIVKKFKEKLIVKIENGKFIMNEKDAINLDKMLGLACIAIDQSEKNNKQLCMRNTILETKCESYDCVVKECNRLKLELDKIIINLCLALGRKVNDNEDVMHLTNVCAALCARESEYHYIQKENNELKRTMNKQRELTIKNYDALLDDLDKFQEELAIKNLKILQLKEDVSSLTKMNEKLERGESELLSGFESQYSSGNVFDDSPDKNEINESKLSIVELIYQLEKSSNMIEVENYRLPDLIFMLVNTIRHKEEHFETINNKFTQNVEYQNQLLKEFDDSKEWQQQLENENVKLNFEIEHHKLARKMLVSKENEHNALKKEHMKVQYAYNDLCDKYEHSKTTIDQYKQQLAQEKTKCADSDIIIKTLNSNLMELTDTLDQERSKWNNLKENYKKNENYIKEAVETFTDQLHAKDIEIRLVRDECSTLKKDIDSSEEQILNLKHDITTLEYRLIEQKKPAAINTKKQKKQPHTTTSFLQLDGLLHVMSKIEQQMCIMLDDMCACRKKICHYEDVLYNIQNTIQQESKTKNRWIARYNIEKIEYKKSMSNVIKEKEIISIQHQKEVEDLKKNYDLQITNLTNTIISLRNEIQNLKENLHLTSSNLITAEQIASSQLKCACDKIEHLTDINTTQTLKIEEMRKIIDDEIFNKTSNASPNSIENKSHRRRENSIHIIEELKLNNAILKKLCKMRYGKIEHLENILCNKYKIEGKWTSI